MIKIQRQDRLSILITVTEDDVEKLVDFFSTLLKENKAIIKVTFDYSIVSMKKKSKTEVISLKGKLGNDTVFIKKIDNTITWKVEYDDIEYAIFYFNEGIKNNFFSPAELFQIQVEKNKETDYIYCQFESNNTDIVTNSCK